MQPTSKELAANLRVWSSVDWASRQTLQIVLQPRRKSKKDADILGLVGIVRAWGQFLKRLVNRLKSARKVWECLLSFFKKVASGFASIRRSKSAKGAGPLASFHSQLLTCQG